MSDRLSPPERRLVLTLSAIRDVREQRRDEFPRLLAAVDPDRVRRHLEDQRLLPLLGSRLLDLVPAAAASWEGPVRAAIRAAQLRGLFFEAVQSEAVAALEAAGIPALPLKGTALAKVAHGDPGLRIAGDVDLLVPTSQVLHALAILRRLGYRPPEDQMWVGGLPLLHYTLHRDDASPRIELHWRIHWNERAFSRELLARSHVDGDLRRPERALEGAALLLFHARDGFLGLRLPTDIAAWWDRHRDELPAGALAPIVERHPFLHRSIVGAAASLEAVTGVSAASLVGDLRPDPATRLAVRLSDPFAERRYRSTVANLLLVDWLLACNRDKLGVLRRNVFQPLEHIRAERELASASTGELALRSAGHACATLGRYAPLAAQLLWRVRGGRWLELGAELRVSAPAAT